LSLLTTPKCLGFFVLFLLEIAVSYWLSLLLFHILSQSESLNSQWNLHCINQDFLLNQTVSGGTRVKFRLLPLQPLWWHFAWNSCLPWHLFPPCAGSGRVQLRTRVLTPESHVTEQELHLPQSDHLPCTKKFKSFEKLNVDWIAQLNSPPIMS
jgi:hypothetical protein